MDKNPNINESTSSSESSSSESSDSEDETPLIDSPNDKKRKYNDIDNEISNNIPNTKKEILERRKKDLNNLPKMIYH